MLWILDAEKQLRQEPLPHLKKRSAKRRRYGFAKNERKHV